MKRKKLVFCRDCQHYQSGLSDSAHEHCLIEQKKPIRRFATYYRPDQPRDPIGPWEKNGWNDCQDFKAVTR